MEKSSNFWRHVDWGAEMINLIGIGKIYNFFEIICVYNVKLRPKVTWKSPLPAKFSAISRP